MSKIIKTGELDYAKAFISNTDDSGNTIEKKLYAPIFRIRNTYLTRRNDMNNFLNFTVWWESSLGYSAKTYSINVIITSSGGYRYIFKDETPDNQEFEVIALSDNQKDSYTTYYVTFPNILSSGYNIYDDRCAQIIVNKSDLIENIEFLGARPFDVDITTTTLTLYRDVLPDVGIVETNLHHITGTYRNQAFIRNGIVYVNYGIHTNDVTTNVVGDVTGILKLTGIKPTQKVRVIAPYISSEGNGICTFIINTDGTIDIEGSQKNMRTHLEFILDKAYYKISSEE